MQQDRSAAMQLFHPAVTSIRLYRLIYSCLFAFCFMHVFPIRKTFFFYKRNCANNCVLHRQLLYAKWNIGPLRLVLSILSSNGTQGSAPVFSSPNWKYQGINLFYMYGMCFNTELRGLTAFCAYLCERHGPNSHHT